MRNVLFPFLLLTACGPASTGTEAPEPPPAKEAGIPLPTERAKAEYDVAKYFPGHSKDSLLADMVTFLYKRPNAAINRDRTLPEFRSYYVDKLPLFTHVYHTMTPDSVHWYYLIRPARSVEGDKRGVGGWFRAGGTSGMEEFVEVFNTRVMPEYELYAKGLELFEHMVANGDVEGHPMREAWVEWPDERLKYDRERREWRYVD